MHPAPLAPKGRDRLVSAVLTAVERAVDALAPAPPFPLVPRRIVVIKSCCLGDLILATPLLGVLRRAYPSAHITAAVGGWSRPALLNNPDVDDVLDLEDVGVGRPGLATYTRVTRRLRTARFDLALVLDRTPLLTALPLLAGIRVRAGIDSAGRGFPLNVRVPWTAVEHEARLFLRVGAALGLPTDGAALRFVPTAHDCARARDVWRSAGLSGQRAVALFPGGGRNPGMTLDAKRWPVERYAALADRLFDECALTPVLMGAESDRAVTARVRRLARAPVVDLTGKATIGELAALFAHCDLFVGNDSGPMHLAAAMDVPVVAIYGPTDPAVYAPFSPRSIALRGPRGVSTAEVGVDDAVDAARHVLHGKGHAP